MSDGFCIWFAPTYLMSMGADGLVGHGRVNDLVNVGAVTFGGSKLRNCGFCGVHDD